VALQWLSGRTCTLRVSSLPTRQNNVEGTGKMAKDDTSRTQSPTDDVLKYDLAFSFVREDEGIANQLNDLVQDRYRTFLYSKAQELLAGTDGEKTFNSVFGEQARTVAVLFRKEWGHTPWTRIEETAIRNRAHDQGYDFVTFIVTEPGAPLPQWLPKVRIWYDFPRFGLNGAAALLGSRIQEQGGTAVEESIADRAARLKRAQQFNAQKEEFHRSYEGVKAAGEAYKRLVADLKSNDNLVRSIGGRIQDAYGDMVMLVAKGVVMTAQYIPSFANTLDKAYLEVGFYDGVPRVPGLMVWENPRTLKKWKFQFALIGPGRTGWVGPDRDRKEHAPEAMAEFLLKHFMELQHRHLG
jgi:hypothetical protein